MTPTKQKTLIGQFEASIIDIEAFLALDDFKDYSDAVQTCIAHINNSVKTKEVNARG